MMQNWRKNRHLLIQIGRDGAKKEAASAVPWLQSDYIGKEEHDRKRLHPPSSLPPLLR
jgi:hypothetical protein